MRYVNAKWLGGAAAGYALGRNRMRACVLHYTVGRDSRPIGLRGYFHFLIAKDGTVFQFAEADALCWHAGEWNGEGPGIEFERMSDAEPLTPGQIESGGHLIAWLAGLGIADNFYDGPRRAPGSWAGFITHRSLQQSEPHSDYVTETDWRNMRAVTDPPSPVPPSPGGEPVKPEMHRDPNTGTIWLLYPGTPWRTAVKSEDDVRTYQFFGVPYRGNMEPAFRDFTLRNTQWVRTG